MTDFFELILGDKCKRCNNKYLSLLNLIWSKPVSRKDLAQALNISKVAVTKSIEQLIDFGFVEEDRQSSTGMRGRQPVPLVLNRDLFYSVGVSLYREGFSGIVLLNARSEKIDETILDDLSLGWREKCDYIMGEAKTLIEKNGVPFSKIAGLGMVLSGIINPETGIVMSSSQFKDEDTNFNIAEYCGERFGKKVFLINTGHASAYVEHKWGGAQNMQSFLCLHSGFGLGMFLNGRLYRGHQYHGGEAGSMQIDSKGPRGADGRVGTLEALVPFYKITDTLDEIIAKNGKTEVRKYLSKPDEKVTFAMIVNAIADGDQLCSQMMSEHFEVISRAIVNLAYIFNPEAIFLPMWTAKCPDASLEIVRRVMGHYGVSNWELKTEILSAQCGNGDFAKGAALLPLEDIFGNPL